MHTSVSHGQHIDEGGLYRIQHETGEYLEFFRANFPMKIIPKMHMLEGHIVPWIRRWGFGMVIQGEQEVESIYAQLNTAIGTAYQECDEITSYELCTPNPKLRYYTNK